jgi:hypothetical protein
VENTQWLKVNEAAVVTDVSCDTILRNLKAGAFPRSRRAAGAGGSATGPWLIPVADLIAAGLRADLSRIGHAPEETVTSAPTACPDSTITKLAVVLLWSWSLERRRVCDLEAENARMWKVLGDSLRCRASVSAAGEGAPRAQD